MVSRLVVILCIVVLTGCVADWRAAAQEQAKDVLWRATNDRSLQFSRVQVTGDQKSGQTCGYYERTNEFGGKDTARFIVFIDGADGQNPYSDSPSAPYPENKSDFDLSWRTQCLDLGYAA
jgi:hypothetical protein